MGVSKGHRKLKKLPQAEPEQSEQEISGSGDFPAGPLVKNSPANAGTWVQYLV